MKIAAGAPWVVLKFGGTSVSSLASWRNVAGVVRERIDAGEAPVVVHSALSGITNALLKVEAPGLSPVLVRAYGPETDRVIDRERENRLFARLSARGFAPAYLARFENGRVEGFLPGTRALEPHELGAPRWQGSVARRLAELHAMDRCALLGEESPARTFETLRAWTDQADPQHHGHRDPSREQ